jgi:hypothetical protein
MSTMLATGHPPIPTNGTFDFVPLLYTALLFIALWRSRLPLRIWVLPVILLAGGLIDSIANALHISSMTIIALLTLLATAVPSRRTPARPPGPPTV